MKTLLRNILTVVMSQFEYYDVCKLLTKKDSIRTVLFGFSEGKLIDKIYLHDVFYELKFLVYFMNFCKPKGF